MKLTIRILLLTTLVILPFHAGYAQSRDEDDPGVDVAVVISIRANLRERPSTYSPVIKELKRGDVLALLKRASVGPWYNVIDIQSSSEGWINGNTIRVKFTEKRKGGPVFQERPTGRTDDPSIKVTNDSDRILYLKVGDDDRIVISAHVTRAMTKLPGTYSFYASSPGVIPAFGQHDFRSGIVYEWTFYIVTRLR